MPHNQQTREFLQRLFGQCKDSTLTIMTLPDKTIHHYPSHELDRFAAEGQRLGAVANTYCDVNPKRKDLQKGVCGGSNDVQYLCFLHLEVYIQKIFVERIGKKEEEGFLKGTGSGMPLGLIYQTPVGAVSEKAGAISIDDMIDLMHSLEEPYRKNAIWLVSEDAYLKLRKITNHNGVPLWSSQLEKGEPLTLLGHPILVSAYLDSVVSGSKPVLFGDFSYFWIGDRGKRVIKRLIERFADRGQVAFLTSERVDAKLVLPEAIKCLEVKAA